MKLITDRNCIILFLFGCLLIVLMIFYPANQKIIKQYLPIVIIIILFGFLSPIVALILCPKYIFIPSILLFFFLFSLISADTMYIGTSGNTWEHTTYGWPTKYMTILYHKGGKWVENEANVQGEWERDTFFKIEKIEVVWLNIFPNFLVSFVFAFIVTIPMRLINWKKARR